MDDNEKKYEPDSLDTDVFDDSLEEIDGVKYETSDDWEFDAKAPTLDDLVVGDDEYVISVDKATEKSIEEKYKKKKEPVDDKNQVVINKDVFTFVPAALFVLLCGMVLTFFGYQYYHVPNGLEGDRMNPGGLVCEVDNGAETEKISIGMYNYYLNQTREEYLNYASQGLVKYDPSVDATLQFTTDDEGNTVTWDAFFRKQAINRIQEVYAYYNEGIKLGLGVTEEQSKLIEDQINELKNQASEQGVSLDEFISANYGQYCTETTLRTMMNQIVVYSNYSNYLVTLEPFSDKEINNYFEQHKDKYYQVPIRFLQLPYDPEAVDESFKAAKDYMSKITDEESLEKLIPEVYKDDIQYEIENQLMYNPDADKDELEKEITESYITSNSATTIQRTNSVLDADTIEWLFNDDTKVGETQYCLNVDYGAIFVIYKAGEKEVINNEVYAVRHILITPKSDTQVEYDDNGNPIYTDEEWAEAKKQADDVLKLYNNGDKTQLSFAELAEDYSDDTASLAKSGSVSAYGGLYENVPAGKMVPEFEGWAFDKARKYGDVEIVKSKYGYHIMYFISCGEQYKAMINTELKTEKINELISKTKVSINEEVMNKAKGVSSVTING